jgi:hypothetical protein
VQAKGILEPGDKIGSSSLTIVLEASPIVEGAVYTDNYGGKYSGRYRYGMQVIVNEPLRSGGGSVIDGGGLSGCVSIENSENSGDIKGSNSVGGIMGGSGYTKLIDKVINYGTVTGTSQVGGILGNTSSGKIGEALNLGQVSAENSCRA